MKRFTLAVGLVASISVHTATAMERNPDYSYLADCARFRDAVLRYPITFDARLQRRFIINEFANRFKEIIPLEIRQVIAEAVVSVLYNTSRSEFEGVTVATSDLNLHECLLADGVAKDEALRNARAITLLVARGATTRTLGDALARSYGYVLSQGSWVVYSGAGAGSQASEKRTCRRSRTCSIRSLFEYFRLDEEPIAEEDDEGSSHDSDEELSDDVL